MVMSNDGATPEPQASQAAPSEPPNPESAGSPVAETPGVAATTDAAMATPAPAPVAEEKAEACLLYTSPSPRD